MMWIAVIVALGVGAGLIEKWMKHTQKMQELRNLSVRDEVELEKLRHENFLLETEKLRLSLDTKRQELSYSQDPLINELSSLKKEKA